MRYEITTGNRRQLGLALVVALMLGLLSLPAESQSLCAPRCVSRTASGRCTGYEADYCSVDATCARQCTSRMASGSCMSYAEDFCAPRAVCSSVCSSRDSTGGCQSYAEDSCGTSSDTRPPCEACRGEASCVPGRDCVDREHRCVRRCVERTATGRCTRYGEDFCGPGADCGSQCSVRTATGTCMKYDEDFCAARDGSSPPSP
jgi:hypothetical protein